MTLLCAVCWLVEEGETPEASFVINGVSVCAHHGVYAQGGELASILRLVQEKK